MQSENKHFDIRTKAIFNQLVRIINKEYENFFRENPDYDDSKFEPFFSIKVMRRYKHVSRVVRTDFTEVTSVDVVTKEKRTTTYKTRKKKKIPNPLTPLEVKVQELSKEVKRQNYWDPLSESWDPLEDIKTTLVEYDTIERGVLQLENISDRITVFIDGEDDEKCDECCYLKKKIKEIEETKCEDCEGWKKTCDKQLFLMRELEAENDTLKEVNKALDTDNNTLKDQNGRMASELRTRIREVRDKKEEVNTQMSIIGDMMLDKYSSGGGRITKLIHKYVRSKLSNFIVDHPTVFPSSLLTIEDELATKKELDEAFKEEGISYAQASEEAQRHTKWYIDEEENITDDEQEDYDQDGDFG